MCTICYSGWWEGGVSAWGVSAQMVYAQGGVWPGGVCPGGCLTRGCLPRRGVCPSACWDTHLPLWTESQMTVRHNHSTTTVADGKNHILWVGAATSGKSWVGHCTVQTCSLEVLTPTGGHRSGQYASYWNAFLFFRYYFFDILLFLVRFARCKQALRFTINCMYRFYYRPQTKFAKVMFLHVSVSHYVFRGRVSRPTPGGVVSGPHPEVSRPTPRGIQAHTQEGLKAHTQGSPGPHLGGSQGSHPGGSPGPHPGRVSPGPHPVGSPGPHPGGLQAHTQEGLQAHTPGGSPGPACTGADPPDGHCCGRYASYWNAFLFLKNVLTEISCCGFCCSDAIFKSFLPRDQKSVNQKRNKISFSRNITEFIRMQM